MNKSKIAFATCALSAALVAQHTLVCTNVLASSNSTYPNINSTAYNSNNIFTQSGFKGQCTWFTYGRVLEKLGINLPSQFYGNAIDWWYSNIRSSTYPYGSEPKSNSIIVWSGGSKGYGHVGFVEKVVGDTIYYNEGNVEKRGYYDGYVKTISKEAIKNRGNLFLKGYIYLGDGSNSNNTNNNMDNYPVIKTSKVFCSSLNVRSKPSLSSSVIGGLSKNQTVSIISQDKGWSKIKYDSAIGYVNSKYLSNNNTITSYNDVSPDNEVIKSGFVKLSKVTSLLNVRTSPSTSSNILGGLRHGTSISILGKTGQWYKIKYGSKIAYISANYVSSNNTNDSKTISTGTVKLSSTSSSLNVRASSNLSSNILGVLKNGTSVSILGETGQWYKVKYGSDIGYVSSKYINTANSSTNSKPTLSKNKYGTVHLSSKYSTLNIRKNANINSSVISSLGYGSKVEILSSVGQQWYRIKFNQTTGYVSSKYIR